MSNTVIIIPQGNTKSRQQRINEETARRDYADLSKRDLALSVADWAWEQGKSEGEETVIFSRGFITFLIIVVTVVVYFMFDATFNVR